MKVLEIHPVHVSTAIFIYNNVHMYLNVFWQQVLVDDPSLLEVEHDICQLIGVLQYLVRSQAVLEEGEGGRGAGQRGGGGDNSN